MVFIKMIGQIQGRLTQDCLTKLPLLNFSKNIVNKIRLICLGADSVFDLFQVNILVILMLPGTPPQLLWNTGTY